MEKKYQLVAWTKNITDKENARLYVVPSVKSDLIKPLIKEIAKCRKQMEKDNGHVSLELARRFIRVYEQCAELEILTGNIAQAIRFFLLAANYCTWEDSFYWDYYDTDLGSYPVFYGNLRREYKWYCEKALSLARKYGFEYVLDEKNPKLTLKFYWEHTQEGRDLKRHLKEVSAWL